jgi:hypothetical protein
MAFAAAGRLTGAGPPRIDSTSTLRTYTSLQHTVGWHQGGSRTGTHNHQAVCHACSVSCKHVLDWASSSSQHTKSSTSTGWLEQRTSCLVQLDVKGSSPQLGPSSCCKHSPQAAALLPPPPSLLPTCTGCQVQWMRRASSGSHCKSCQPAPGWQT